VPTYEVLPRFWRDYAGLARDQQEAVLKAVRAFVTDLKSRKFRQSLRVKAVQGAAGIFEMTWAHDGRATFEYRDPVRAHEAHVIWRRCGTHAVLRKP